MGGRRRRVAWTETAVRGLDSCIAFAARESVDNAHRLLERLLDAADSLGTLSERGSPVPEYREPDLRQLLVNPFRLLYRASESEVFILGILHQRQDVARWRDDDTADDAL
jgi:toxin ParE1/3/4